MVSAPTISARPDTRIFARWRFLSAIRRPARSSAGSTGGPNSGSSMSAGYFCPRICAARGSAGAYLAVAEEEGRRRGCTRIALTTLSVEAPGFYQKRGYDIAATIDCDPPGLTRYYMMKRLVPPRG